MTMRSFGNVMPIHISILRLACYSVHWDERDIRQGPSDEACLRQLRAGRNALRRATRQDFGYDLAAWRRFLLDEKNGAFGYRHPYAFANVDRAIRNAIRSERRKRLVEQLEEQAPSDDSSASSRRAVRRKPPGE